LPVALQEDGCVLVELDVRAVRTTDRLLGANDDGLDHIALLDVSTRDRVLDGGDDGVTQTGVTAARTTESTDREQLLRAGVVGDLEAGFLLNHYYSLSKPKAYLAFSTISTRRQRLVALSGRVSLMTTRSPMPAELVSSCTLRFSVRRMTLP